MSNDEQDRLTLRKAGLDGYERIDPPGFQPMAAKLRAGGPPPNFRASAASPLVLDTDVGGDPWEVRSGTVIHDGSNTNTTLGWTPQPPESARNLDCKTGTQKEG